MTTKMEELKAMVEDWISTALKTGDFRIPNTNDDIVTVREVKKQDWYKDLPKTREEALIELFKEQYDITENEIRASFEEEDEEDFEKFLEKRVVLPQDFREEEDEFISQDYLNGSPDDDLFYWGEGYMEPISDYKDVLKLLCIDCDDEEEIEYALEHFKEEK